jgi:TatD DNase family protein
MIDTHCHIDLYSDPLKIANDSEKLGIITIGMTNLPSHFEMGYPHLTSHLKVRLALGMHPLYAEAHEKEFRTFLKNLDKTSYIGEVGLDFSREGYLTKDIQLDTFKKILLSVTGRKKLLSLHSRRAEKEVLGHLKQYNIKAAIFHWYSGPLNLIEQIASSGYYFSVNTAMIISENGQKIIKKIPTDKILTESDGPFIETNGRPAKPNDVILVQKYLSTLWDMPLSDVSDQIRNNFQKIISLIK